MHKHKGFTIAELLIVIVVIGILAAITIVAYNGLQDRARAAKISSDLVLLERAIHSARISSGDVALQYITGSIGSSNACVWSNNGVDLSSKTAAADCWNGYTNALRSIRDAGGVDVTNLSDPLGRPYMINENELEGGGRCGNGRDIIGTFPNPRTRGNWSVERRIDIAYVTPGC